MDDTNGTDLALNMFLVSGCATVLFGSALAYVLLKRRGPKSVPVEVEQEEEEEPELDKTKYPGGYLTIYYGSQTGTAQSFATDLEGEGETNGFKVNVVDMEDIEDKMKETILHPKMRDDNGNNRAIFLMATYGEGEPTDNAVPFVNLMREKAGIEILSHEGKDSDSHNNQGEEKKSEDGMYMGVDKQYFSGLEFAVFGLGNRQYDHFNAMGRFTDNALEKVGATRILEIGLGDDDNDLEADFENWKDNILWSALRKKYQSDGKSKKNSKAIKVPDCQYAVEYLDGKATPDDIPMDKIHSSSKYYFTSTACTVSVKKELREPTDGGSTKHIEIDVSQPGFTLNYTTADNMAILPVNDEKTVEAVAKALNFDLDATFRLGPASGQEAKYAAPFPTPCTVRDCLSKYCDITGPPRRSDLKHFAVYATESICKNALKRMSSKEGRAEYKEKVLEAHIGIVDIVSRLCPSIEMSLEHFISVCPRLQPRYYTISSSSSVHPKSVHVTVAVTKSQRKDKSTFKGVCSNYLADIVDGEKVQAFIRPSTFRLPSDASKPIVMIGPGTGIAPMRALLQERSYQKNKLKADVGSNILYFGCKKKNLDYLYSDELKAFQKDGILNQLHLAFSREQKEKVYVQHLIAKNAKDTWDLIDSQTAYIYVCGGVKMGQDVSEALRNIISQCGGRSEAESKSYLDKMASEGRFVQELWA